MPRPQGLAHAAFANRVYVEPKVFSGKGEEGLE